MDHRTKLIAALIGATDSRWVANHEAALEYLRDHLCDRDGAGDPEMYGCFVRLLQAVDARFRAPEPQIPVRTKRA